LTGWHSLFSFMNTSSDIYIVLKRSLKWVPIVGWVCSFLPMPYAHTHINAPQGMHFFKFIFLARNWEQDRKRLARHLAKLGQEAKEDNLPFSFLFFPEGTVVSKLTRPKSKKFAEREGVVRNTVSHDVSKGNPKLTYHSERPTARHGAHSSPKVYRSAPRPAHARPTYPEFGRH
jgi:1-acyl-sn-glycerol-3-phosphate acyltransferase